MIVCMLITYSLQNHGEFRGADSNRSDLASSGCRDPPGGKVVRQSATTADLDLRSKALPNGSSTAGNLEFMNRIADLLRKPINSESERRVFQLLSPCPIRPINILYVKGTEAAW